MITGRGWWTLVMVMVVLFFGVALAVSPLTVIGLTLLGWFLCEWLFFALRVRIARFNVRLTRTVSDGRGPVTTLWAGRTFTVAARVTLPWGRVPFAVVTDPVPFAVRHVAGDTRTDGVLSEADALAVEYTVQCPAAGVARFEGVRVELADHQGMFGASFFVRDPVELRVLPAVVVPRGGPPLTKRESAVPPPGVHRLHQPGSSSELLDLRDYQPGDPPRTIAWKVSARRDKLITREFESEVPVRCVVFLDASSAVLLPSPVPRTDEQTPAYRPVDRLVEIAAAVVRTNAARRDLTGLTVFDDDGVRVVRPNRGGAHVNAVMKALGEAAARGPRAGRADPMPLLPVAHALANEVYPDLLAGEVNEVPAWVAWLVGAPSFTRHWRGWIDWLYRRKRSVLLWGVTFIPLGAFALNVVAALTDGVPEEGRGLLALFGLFGVPLIVAAAWAAFVFSLLFSWKQPRQFRMRKRVAALLAVRHHLPAGGLEALMQDDDQLSLHLQRFLAEHQVPYALPLYDERGRYLPASPRRAGVLGKAVVDAAGRGRDNELYVVLADLLDLGDDLAPLLQAARVARARHHQMVIVQPWPRGLPVPDESRREAKRESVLGLLTGLLQRRMHESFFALRREFARLGVPVVCAEADEAVGLVLERMERLRSVGGRR
ncbi:MAG: DUF58 domain-containing protein [Gemmataceae bacterium]